jgi:hypothetical protein
MAPIMVLRKIRSSNHIPLHPCGLKMCSHKIVSFPLSLAHITGSFFGADPNTGGQMALYELHGRTLPGRDSTSKSMSQMVAYGHQMREVFDLEAEGLKPEDARSQAEWARTIAAEIRKQGMAKSKEVIPGNGEAVPPEADTFFYDTLTVPDLAAVEASFDRSRLLTEQGADVAAMALDVANTIQAGNSSEKCWHTN